MNRRTALAALAGTTSSLLCPISGDEPGPTRRTGMGLVIYCQSLLRRQRREGRRSG